MSLTYTRIVSKDNVLPFQYSFWTTCYAYICNGLFALLALYSYKSSTAIAANYVVFVANQCFTLKSISSKTIIG